MMRSIKYTLSGLALSAFAAGLHYALPQVDVVRVVGTDVKRVDVTEVASGSEEPRVRTSDVYFLLAESPGGRVRNYRNQDAWVYLKFDSSDLHTRLRSISQDEENLVAVRHYGWRIPVFSAFPNAVNAWPVEPGYRHIPVFNILFLSILFSGIGYLGWRIRRFRQAWTERLEQEARAQREADARRDRERRKAPGKDLEDFLSEDQ